VRDLDECKRNSQEGATVEEYEYKTYMCMVCGFIYDEAQGWPEDGIPPGTRWEDVPETWVCPECGAIKDDFEMEEI
jgi:rubredoxin